VPAHLSVDRASPILITGGAGFLGINLCRFLLARRHAVRSLDIARFAYPERVTVDAVEGDIRDPTALDKALEGVHPVVHAAAALSARRFGTMRDSFQAVLDRAEHGRHVIGIPAAPAIAILRFLERVHLSPIYPWIYETAARDSYVSTERIAARLGFLPRYSNREALIRNYDWYVAHRDEIRGKTGISHRVPWDRRRAASGEAVDVSPGHLHRSSLQRIAMVVAGLASVDGCVAARAGGSTFSYCVAAAADAAYLHGFDRWRRGDERRGVQGTDRAVVSSDGQGRDLSGDEPG